MPADRLPLALADLDPGNRALLDLSLRRGVSDAEIGELLRKEPDEVARGRDAVLGLLADALQLDGHDRRERVRRAVAELPEEVWTGTRSAPPPEPLRPDFEESAGSRASVHVDLDEPEPAFEPEPEAELEPEPEPEAELEPEPEAELEPEPEPEPDDREQKSPFSREVGPGEGVFLPPAREQRSRKGLLWGMIGLLLVLGAVGVLLIGGSDDDDGGGDSGPTPADRDEPTPAGKRVALRAIAGEAGSGSFTPQGDGRYVLVLKDLPEPSGAYQAWLYNSLVDSIPLGTFREGSGRLVVRLPANADDYRFLDVSQEPADGNRNHSGDSVMRARLKPLLEQ